MSAQGFMQLVGVAVHKSSEGCIPKTEKWAAVAGRAQ